MKLNIDLYASRLKIIPREPLPFQLRKKREERIKMVKSRQLLDRDYPQFNIAYDKWDYPMIDQSMNLGMFRDANNETTGYFTYTTYATADLLNMESVWYLQGNDQEIVDEARLTLGKRDPTGNLAAPLDATEYLFGYFNEPTLNLITLPLEPLPGALISSFPLTRQIQFDSQNFRGDLPPGWQVELYHNNSLIDFQATPINGLYQFDNVPLLFGNNYFRLVFYGPQGQQREETSTYYLDDSLVQPGKHYYRALVSEDSVSGYRMIAQYEKSLNRSITLAANVASIPLADLNTSTEVKSNHNYIN